MALTLSVPGYEDFILELSTVLLGYPPPFIYIHDYDGFEITTTVLKSLLQHLSTQPNPEIDSSSICWGYADAICCLSQRSLYESFIHTLVDFQPDWETGCGNWRPQDGLKWNETMDSFLQGLRSAHSHLCKERQLSSAQGLRMVLLIEGVDCLKESMPEILVPLTRLHELSQLDLCVICVSQVSWEAVKPPLAASPSPYFVDISPRHKASIVQMLISSFSDTSKQHPDSNLYHPALRALYSQFTTTLCDICYVFTHDPQELRYIAAARWPGFVRPILDKYHQKLPGLSEDSMAVDLSTTLDENMEPPSEEDRLRLIRMFSASFTAALESLYPRLTDAADWAKANEPEADLLSQPPNEFRMAAKPEDSLLANLPDYLPRMSKFILVASFLSSTNPAKSDLRMFGRGLDDKKRRKRTVVKAKGGVAKIPQRLVGPSPFPLDRLIAILGSLVEENDAESRLAAEEFSIPGEYTDMEISRRNVHSSILELVSGRLLHRTTKPDQLDGPPMFKCAISHEMAMSLAKELKVPLLDLLWEPVS